MKVVHVTDTDLPARRFSGYDLMSDLRPMGIEGKQIVLTKTSSHPDVVAFLRGPAEVELQRRIAEVELRHSMDNLLYPWGRVLAETREFLDADVVHYHLIHNRVISLYDLKWLFHLKPSVWTFHDPWPLTGHCVHPMTCEGWLRGCSPCPFLGRLFPLAHDTADRMWELKRQLFSDLDADIVVASAWMLEMVRRSQLTAHLDRVNLIPFGLDTTSSLPDAAKDASRRRIGVAVDEFVVLVRASSWEVKGLDYIIRALNLRPPTRGTTVISLDEPGRLSDLRSEYRVVDLGWVEDSELYATILSAADTFVMPSLAESFGLMAVEAMAAGRPVVCFDGTALPGVTHAPECGIAVPAQDVGALRAALDHLSRDREDGLRRGRLGRTIVAREFGHQRYLDRLADLYALAVRRRAGAA